MSSDKRAYYLVSKENEAYMLVSIYRHADSHVNITSFARIHNIKKGFAVECMKQFFEEILLPFCRDERRRLIVVATHTKKGSNILENLCDGRISGIELKSKTDTPPDLTIWNISVQI